MHARIRKAQSTASVCTKICFFSWKNCQKWPFLGQKLSILASNRQLQSPPPPPNLRVLDAKKHAVWTQRLPEHNLQHSYAPKSAIFQQNRQKIAIFYQNLFVSFSLKQAAEPPPPPNWRVLVAKKRNTPKNSIKYDSMCRRMG